MKKIFVIISVMLLSLNMTCDKDAYVNYNKIKFVCVASVFDENIDSINLHLQVLIPKNYFKKKMIITLLPLVELDNWQYKLEPIILHGESFVDEENIIPYNSSKILGFNYKIRKIMDIDKYNLLIKGDFYSNHNIELPERKVPINSQ